MGHFWDSSGQTVTNDGDNTMKVLIDRNIEINATTHKSTLVPKTVPWGDTAVTCDVLERVARKLSPNDIFIAEQLPYLATICLMAKSQAITFYSSNELRMERIRQPGWFDNKGYVGLNLLEGIKVECVRCPVDRTIVFAPFGDSEGTTKEEQLEFFRSITDPRFLEISGAVNNKRIDDAYHLWTAEVNMLDAFLTMDKKFWEDIIRNNQRINSNVAVLTPKELCERLNAEPSDIDAIAAAHHPFS